MKLYMVRHGIADRLGENGVQRDADRPLSAIGVDKTRAAARGLLALDHRPDVIGSSPLVRARQTAELFHEELGVQREIAHCEFMAPGGMVTRLIAWLKESGADTALLVGHMPDLAWMTNACLPEEERHDIHFKKAAVACLSFKEHVRVGAGQLDAMYQPRQLRAAARQA